MSKLFALFCEENSDKIDELYVEHHFETIGYGGDYDPMDNLNEALWMEIAQEYFLEQGGSNEYN